MTKRVLVVGASGATGRVVVTQLLERGCSVTAFVRNPASLPIEHANARIAVGDATRVDDLRRVMPGHDAVVVTLGISENPLLVRLRGARRTPTDIRSRGTRNVIAAMRDSGVRRLVVQTTYGVGETWSRLSLGWKFMFWAILKPQIEDTEVQESIVRASELDWTLVEPVGLTDAAAQTDPFVSADGDIEAMSIPRADVAEFLASVTQQPTAARTTFALSSRRRSAAA